LIITYSYWSAQKGYLREKNTFDVYVTLGTPDNDLHVSFKYQNMIIIDE
jgi:hypothetical protein